MANKSGRGSAESSWHVARRCLAIINRLQQGAASKQELITTIYRSEDTSIPDTLLAKRFENDKLRLWDKLGVRIRYDRKLKGYVIAEWERPLLNLPDADIQTLGLLSDTFQPESPHTPEIQQLIDRLASWLPPNRQKLLQKISGQQPTADLRLRDNEEIAPDVWENVLEAWQAKQELQFDYLSSRHDDALPRQHKIQPWDLTFTDRGHWQLRGYCLFNDGPHGPWHPNDYINYRVSRIVARSVKVLPRKLPPIRLLGHPRQVIFELSPEIARFGVSQRKELVGEPTIVQLDEGWVRVEGTTYDVFDLARNLLYYGANCRVLGGKELMEEMRSLVAGLADIYQ